MTISISQFQQTAIEKWVALQAGARPTTWDIMMQTGIAENVKEWANDASAFVYNWDTPGWVSFQDYENAKEVSKVPVEKTAKMFALGAKIVMGPAELAHVQSNELGIQVGFASMQSSILADLKRQINSVIANGNTARYGAKDDPSMKDRGSNTFPGVYNGTANTDYVTISMGTDNDNNISAYGDLQDSYANALDAVYGHVDDRRCFCVMDPPTFAAVAKLRHATSGKSELAAFKEAYPNVQIDIDESILERESDAVYSDMHKIAFVFPFDTNGEGLLKLKVSKDLHVQPVGGGTIQPDGKFHWLLGWKGGVLKKSAYAVVVPSANLTIA
ncbi:MAG: hypothetical protein Q6365_022250 [Candidatus Sigynarchaeota archaeon]